MSSSASSPLTLHLSIKRPRLTLIDCLHTVALVHQAVRTGTLPPQQQQQQQHASPLPKSLAHLKPLLRALLRPFARLLIDTYYMRSLDSSVPYTTLSTLEASLDAMQAATRYYIYPNLQTSLDCGVLSRLLRLLPRPQVYASAHATRLASRQRHPPSLPTEQRKFRQMYPVWTKPRYRVEHSAATDAAISDPSMHTRLDADISRAIAGGEISEKGSSSRDTTDLTPARTERDTHAGGPKSNVRSAYSMIPLELDLEHLSACISYCAYGELCRTVVEAPLLLPTRTYEPLDAKRRETHENPALVRHICILQEKDRELFYSAEQQYGLRFPMGVTTNEGEATEEDMYIHDTALLAWCAAMEVMRLSSQQFAKACEELGIWRYFGPEHRGFVSALRPNTYERYFGEALLPEFARGVQAVAAREALTRAQEVAASSSATKYGDLRESVRYDVPVHNANEFFGLFRFRDVRSQADLCERFQNAERWLLAFLQTQRIALTAELLGESEPREYFDTSKKDPDNPDVEGKAEDDFGSHAVLTDFYTTVDEGDRTVPAAARSVQPAEGQFLKSFEDDTTVQFQRFALHFLLLCMSHPRLVFVGQKDALAPYTSQSLFTKTPLHIIRGSDSDACSIPLCPFGGLGAEFKKGVFNPDDYRKYALWQFKQVHKKFVFTPALAWKSPGRKPWKRLEAEELIEETIVAGGPACAMNDQKMRNAEAEEGNDGLALRIGQASGQMEKRLPAFTEVFFDYGDEFLKG